MFPVNEVISDSAPLTPAIWFWMSSRNVLMLSKIVLFASVIWSLLEEITCPTISSA